MNYERMKQIEEILLCAAESELCDIEEADTKELGEVVDMIKDLEEAIYYCTVTEAMNSPHTEMEWEMKKGDHYRKEDNGRMYYDGYPKKRKIEGGGHTPGMMPMYPTHGGEKEHDDAEWRDEREGRSHYSRKMYMEARDMNKDKAMQLRELEKYMQELSQDVTEMIAEASPEEKQYLEKKISALAIKVGQMK